LRVRYLLHAQPDGELQVRFAAMQVSPQALPTSQTLQQLSPPPPQPCKIEADAVTASGMASATILNDRNMNIMGTSSTCCDELPPNGIDQPLRIVRPADSDA